MTVVVYDLPTGVIPSGKIVKSVDTRVCGTASGAFYETYGPGGSDPHEYEITQPAADGCWHFVGATGVDYTVLVKVLNATTVTITKVEYTLRF